MDCKKWYQDETLDPRQIFEGSTLIVSRVKRANVQKCVGRAAAIIAFARGEQKGNFSSGSSRLLQFQFLKDMWEK